MAFCYDLDECIGGISTACITLASLNLNDPTETGEVYFLTVFAILLIAELLVPFLCFCLFKDGEGVFIILLMCVLPLYLIFSTVFGILALSATILYPVGGYEESDVSAKRSQREAAVVLGYIISALHLLTLVVVSASVYSFGFGADVCAALCSRQGKSTDAEANIENVPT